MVECLAFAFHGLLSDVAAVVAGYQVTLHDRAGMELFTAPLTMFQASPIAGEAVLKILYLFDPHLISPTHPVAYLNAIRPDTPILKDNLSIDAMLVMTRVLEQ